MSISPGNPQVSYIGPYILHLPSSGICPNEKEYKKTKLSVMKRASGKSQKTDIGPAKILNILPGEQSAGEWCECSRWPSGRHFPKCEHASATPVASAKPRPYWHGGCRSRFGVRTGSVVRNSQLPLLKWLTAIHLYFASLDGLSRVKLHRGLNIAQMSACFMLRLLREVDAAARRGGFGPTITAITNERIRL